MLRSKVRPVATFVAAHKVDLVALVELPVRDVEHLAVLTAMREVDEIVLERSLHRVLGAAHAGGHAHPLAAVRSALAVPSHDGVARRREERQGSMRSAGRKGRPRRVAEDELLLVALLDQHETHRPAEGLRPLARAEDGGDRDARRASTAEHHLVRRMASAGDGLVRTALVVDDDPRRALIHSPLEQPTHRVAFRTIVAHRDVVSAYRRRAGGDAALKRALVPVEPLGARVGVECLVRLLVLRALATRIGRALEWSGHVKARVRGELRNLQALAVGIARARWAEAKVGEEGRLCGAF